MKVQKMPELTGLPLVEHLAMASQDLLIFRANREAFRAKLPFNLSHLCAFDEFVFLSDLIDQTSVDAEIQSAGLSLMKVDDLFDEYDSIIPCK